MKLAADLLLGAAAAVAAFFAVDRALTDEPAAAVAPAQARAPVAAPSPHAPDRAPARPAVAPPPAARPVSAPVAPDLPDARALDALEDAALRASATYRDGRAMLACLDGMEVIGKLKLRFRVEVDATPREAKILGWRFIEVAEGQPVPASFGACAERALVGDPIATPRYAGPFPTYRGEVEVIYWLSSRDPDDT